MKGGLPEGEGEGESVYVCMCVCVLCLIKEREGQIQLLLIFFSSVFCCILKYLTLPNKYCEPYLWFEQIWVPHLNEIILTYMC